MARMMASQTAVFTQMVRDHMRAAPACISAGARCVYMLRLFGEANTSCVIVLGENRQIAGIVTEQDVARRLAGRGRLPPPGAEQPPGVMTKTSSDTTCHTPSPSLTAARTGVDISRRILKPIAVTGRCG